MAWILKGFRLERGECCEVAVGHLIPIVVSLSIEAEISRLQYARILDSGFACQQSSSTQWCTVCLAVAKPKRRWRGCSRLHPLGQDKPDGQGVALAGE